MSGRSSVDPRTPGTMLAGKYRVERVIGQGGMGVVLAAWHVALDQRVALKLLLASSIQTPDAVSRFLREARASAKLRSEHVARVIDTGTLEDDAPYMVMEFLSGRDLSAELQVRGPLAIEDAVDFIVQACEAIAEAHGHGIIHRDLKPANLFLGARADGSPIVKVLDFGISKIADGGPQLTGTIDAMGTALYMSPEQMQQTRTVDLRTDIYALGIALHELLAGIPPFHANTVPLLCVEVLTGEPTPLRDVRPDVPEDLARVVGIAHRRDREHRFASVAEFVRALAPHAPSRARPTIDRILRMSGLGSSSATSATGWVPSGVGATDVISRPVASVIATPRGSDLEAPNGPPLAQLATGRPVVTARATTSPSPGKATARSRRVLPIGLAVLATGAALAVTVVVTRRDAPLEQRPAASAEALSTGAPSVPDVVGAPPALEVSIAAAETRSTTPTASATASASAASSASSASPGGTSTTPAVSSPPPERPPAVPTGRPAARPPTDVGF